MNVQPVGMNFFPPPKTYLWVSIHRHRHGQDVLFTRASRQPEEDEVIKLHGLNFEPDRDEEIETFEVSDEQIKELIDG